MHRAPDFTIIRTHTSHAALPGLLQQLDAELAIRDGADHAFYHQFNGLENIQHIVVGYHKQESVACGAFRIYNSDTVEIKRMFVAPSYRGRGYARQVLAALEAWANAEGYTRFILETGINQPEAIALYQRCGYLRMPNYGPYTNKPESLCFEKQLPVAPL